MNRKHWFFLILALNFVVSLPVFSQSKKPKMVRYNRNIQAPLTSLELAWITEVYGTTVNKNVLEKPRRLEVIKNILRNRIKIRKIDKRLDSNRYTLLSQVPLMDYYISNLKRDTNFNPKNFNPLKYLFQFHARGSYYYKVDNSDYFILIRSQHY